MAKVSFLVCFLCFTFCVADLVQVIEVFRHGDRAPVEILDTDPNHDYWDAIGWGQLTPIGINMHHTLGKLLREEYGELVDIRFDFRKTFVRSSDFDRTLESAQSHLAGLFPPGYGNLTEHLWQTVPIHTVAQNVDNLLLSHNKEVCPRVRELQNKNFESEEWKKLESENQDFIKNVAEIAKVEPFPLRSIYEISDPLVCDLAHNLTLPQGFTLEIANKIKILADKGLTNMFKGKELQKLSSGLLIKEILHLMNLHIPKQDRLLIAQPQSHLSVNHRSNREPKLDAAFTFVIFSAHDTTLAALLSALGVFDGENPPYASSVVFELHKNEGKYSVKSFYNKGVPNKLNQKPISLSTCKNTECTFSEFSSHCNELIPEDWIGQCSTQESCPNSSKGLVWGFAIVAALSIIILIGYIVVNRRKSNPDEVYNRFNEAQTSV